MISRVEEADPSSFSARAMQDEQRLLRSFPVEKDFCRRNGTETQLAVEM